MRRTIKGSEAEAPEPEADEVPRASRPVARKRKRRNPEDVARLNLELPHELDFRVAGVAKYRKMRKSAFVLFALDQCCTGHKIDKALKAAWAESQGEDVSAG